jgi:hypothetical protein
LRKNHIDFCAPVLKLFFAIYWNNYVMILSTLVRSEIGLKSPGIKGESTLGIETNERRIYAFQIDISIIKISDELVDDFSYNRPTIFFRIHY